MNRHQTDAGASLRTEERGARPHFARRLAPALCALALAAIPLVNLPPPSAANGQKGKQESTKKPAPPSPAATTATPATLLKRTTTRRETRRLGHGATLAVAGAPEGSVAVEGWQKSEAEVVADIEVSAATEDELTQLASVNGFVLEADFNRLAVNTVGTHDRKYMKRVARDFPKKLLSMPWRVDYRLRAPAIIDLQIATGRGPVTLSNLDGSVRLEAGGGSPSLFTLAGGDFEGIVAAGPVTVRVPSRSWRGRGLTLRLVSGDLTLELPAGFDGDVDAEVLRTGRVENTHPGLAPREDAPAPDGRTLHARAGNGGAALSLTVGDGTLRIRQIDAGQ